MSHARVDYPDFNKIAPELAAALLTLSKVTGGQSGLERDMLELVKVRASQINGCAFCTQYHINMARDLQVPQAKLDLLATWQDAGIYSARERTALAWAEVTTRLPSGGVPDDAYAAAREQFSEKELALLTGAIGVINAWNRLGVAFRFTPPPAKPAT
jgi:AhpD family alkylhydroperoxidase